MEIITSKEELPLQSYQNALTALQNFSLTSSYPTEKLCFFDIETTGLSADISSLYLIGCGYIKEGHLHIMQWFADDYVSEKDLLLSFSEFLKDFDVLIHYNGTGFDIPYMEKKYRYHHIKSPFPRLDSIDFYKLIRPYKKWFPLSNLKLTTVEQFLCIMRNDRFSGKDCIELYSDYMQMKYFREEEKRIACQYALLLHNHDDIIGTFLCSQLLLYLLPFTSEKLIFNVISTERQTLCLETFLPGMAPTAFKQEAGEIHFAYKKNCFRVRIPMFFGDCCYFFKDYKNYYFLPFEDQAIHKSVAAYVDASHREKATSKNCYTKKTGMFLPVAKFKKSQTDFFGVPLFFDKTKRTAYIEWKECSDANTYQKIIVEYICNLLL